MFERFTEEARGVVVLGQDEARMLRHNQIGTEHILLGLLRQEEESGSWQPLQSLGVTLQKTREMVTSLVGSSDEATAGQVPFTPRAKKVLELSLREALSLGYNWIGPEHILLGLARENEGVAARILSDLGADSEKIRNQVIEQLGSRPAVPSASHFVGGHATRVPMELTWFDGLRDVLPQLAREIRQELVRDPDLGDLLLAMACARGTVAGEALREIEVDLDVLWGTLERIRQRRAEERQALLRRIDEVSRKKAQALESQEFEEAAALRDEERELSGQARSQTSVGTEVVREIRRRLGLPTPEK
jgi:Clp amino terminal domain, pathogenicity island component/UvrB/uvrC motif